MRYASQSGNALFLILIAVALFAALAYVFTQGSRSNTSFISEEEKKIQASEVLAFGHDVATSVKRLMLRGCKDTEISFENTVYKSANGTITFPASPGYGFNPNAPTDRRCHVFDIAGGGLIPKVFPKAGIPNISVMQGHPTFTLVQVLDVNTSAPELAMWMGYMAPEICDKISQIVGTGSIAPVDANNSWAIYAGSYGATYSIYGEESTLLKGKKAFCARQTSGTGAQRIFIHVIIPR